MKQLMHITLCFEGVKMMKAALLTSYEEPLEIKQIPLPQVGPNDVLVKLIACGICHSDLHTAKGGKMREYIIL